MRDGQIYQQFLDFEKRMGSDVGLLLRNIAIIETRQKALEKMLLGSRFGMLKLALLQLISPKKATAAIMLTHGALLRKHQENLDAAVREKNQKIRVVPAASPVISLAVAALLLLGGCVSKAAHRKALDIRDLTIDAQRTQYEALFLARTYCEEQQKKLVEILRKFNQVDEAGQLRKGK